jgi:hypothetical protein
MIRFALSCLILIFAAETPWAEDANSDADKCVPQPDCRILFSPLKPGGPTIGIRDKAIIERANEYATERRNLQTQGFEKEKLQTAPQ